MLELEFGIYLELRYYDLRFILWFLLLEIWNLLQRWYNNYTMFSIRLHLPYLVINDLCISLAQSLYGKPTT
jgi:hypothetical protein